MLTIGALGLLAASAAPSAADEGGNLTDFSSMTPVTGAAVGTVNDRGIKGGGLPWAITSGTGTVSHRGTVDVTVTGLLIPVLGNKNPVGMFKATLSCLGLRAWSTCRLGRYSSPLRAGSGLRSPTPILSPS